MLFAYSNGLMLGLSLILVIGPQNAFVLRQGILRQHVGAVVLFCAGADIFLIIAGVVGMSLLITDFVDQIGQWLFGGVAIWLTSYGLLRIRDVFGKGVLKIDHNRVSGLWSSLGVVAALTFGNPHVYLDTLLLIGTISLKFDGVNKLAFAAGAASASLMFFPALGYLGYLMSDVMCQPRAWRLLNGIIAVIMFFLAGTMLQAVVWYQDR